MAKHNFKPVLDTIRKADVPKDRRNTYLKGVVAWCYDINAAEVDLVGHDTRKAILAVDMDGQPHEVADLVHAVAKHLDCDPRAATVALQAVRT